MGIHSVKIQNYKSIRESGEILMKPLNVLIGPNGAGKSNFISFFECAEKNRADNLLDFGRKRSKFLSGQITFDNEFRNEYSFEMIPDQEGNLIFSKGLSTLTRPGTEIKDSLTIDFGGILESRIKNDSAYRTFYLKDLFSSFKILQHRFLIDFI
ncbi:MAG: AAA family ATPase [Ignavibacteria bacterium]|nr:AAA family ATPase [Ignavibacteria bacterium]